MPVRMPRLAFMEPLREAPRPWRPSAIGIRMLAATAALLALWLLAAAVITFIAAGRIGAGKAAVEGAGNVFIGVMYGTGLLALAAASLVSAVPLHRLAGRVWKGLGANELRLGAFVLLVTALLAPALTVLLLVADLGIWFFATAALPLGITAVAVVLVVTAIFWLLAPSDATFRQR